MKSTQLRKLRFNLLQNLTAILRERGKPAPHPAASVHVVSEWIGLEGTLMVMPSSVCCWLLSPSWCPAGALQAHPFAQPESLQERVAFFSVILADLNQVFQRAESVCLDMPPGKGYLSLSHPSGTVMEEKSYCSQLLLPMAALLHPLGTKSFHWWVPHSQGKENWGHVLSARLWWRLL